MERDVASSLEAARGRFRKGRAKTGGPLGGEIREPASKGSRRARRKDGRRRTSLPDAILALTVICDRRRLVPAVQLPGGCCMKRALLFVWLAVPCAALAQETTTGSIAGRVLDPQGARVPEAIVTLRSGQGAR